MSTLFFVWRRGQIVFARAACFLSKNFFFINLSLGAKSVSRGRPAGRPEPIRLGNYRFGAVFFGFATGSFPLRLLSIWCRLFFSEKSYFCIFFTLSAQETRILLARFLLVTIPNMRAENERKNAVSPRFAVFHEKIYISLIIDHHPKYIRIAICLTWWISFFGWVTTLKNTYSRLLNTVNFSFYASPL